MPIKPAITDLRSLWFRSIAFVVGFCVMVIELMSGRITAPYLGSSLYTWTAVLISVLAAIAIGSYVGGKLSESKKVWSRIWLWLVVSALLLMTTTFLLVSTFGPVLRASELPLIALTLIFSFLIFFPPAFTLAMVTPLLVKQDVSSLEESGVRYGELAAWNAAGSIVGTYTAGFLFISYFNTSLVMWIIVGVLLVTAVSEKIMSLKKRTVV